MPNLAKYYFKVQIDATSQQSYDAYAITVGDNANGGWFSNSVTTVDEFKQFADRASGARYFTIAVPKFYQNFFIPSVSNYEYIRIFIADSKTGSYGTFLNNQITARNVGVEKVAPIFQWKGLPAPSQIQINGLSKLIGTQVYNVVAVTLFAATGDVEFT